MAASSSLNPFRFSSSPSSTTYSTPHYRIPNSIVHVQTLPLPTTRDTIVPISSEIAPDTIVPISNTVGQMAGAAALGLAESALVALTPPNTGDTIVQISGNFDPDTMVPISGEIAPDTIVQISNTVGQIVGAAALGLAESALPLPKTGDTIAGEKSHNHPVIALYNQHELGKAILGFAIPVITGLLSMHSISNPLLLNLVVVSLCIGFVCIWIGLLSRALVPTVAIRLEQFGVATVLAAFFGFVSTFVPLYLIWAPWACWALSLLPFALTLF